MAGACDAHRSKDALELLRQNNQRPDLDALSTPSIRRAPGGGSGSFAPEEDRTRTLELIARPVLGPDRAWTPGVNSGTTASSMGAKGR